MINLKLRINDKSEIIIKEYKTKKFTEDDVRVYMKIAFLKILVAEDSWKYEIYPTLHFALFVFELILQIINLALI